MFATARRRPPGTAPAGRGPLGDGASVRAIRLFVAIPLPALLRGQLGRLAAGHPIDGVRWLSPENLHVTVQFLGEVEDTALPELTSALERACARQTPFELAVERVGPAPPGRRARMIWAHLGRSDGYEGLCASVAAAAAPFAPRLALPAHPRAHVTLARFARPGPSRAALDLSPCGDFAVVPVSACRLVRSRLSSAGAAYTTLAGLPLDGGAGVTPPAPA